VHDVAAQLIAALALSAIVLGSAAVRNPLLNRHRRRRAVHQSQPARLRDPGDPRRALG
jgi:hypothetical protein